MQKMKSPTPNRKGAYEEHMVPSRKVGGLQARGWTLVESEVIKEPEPKKTRGRPPKSKTDTEAEQ